MCGGHLESDGAHSARCRFERKKGDSRRREIQDLFINKKGELNTRASLHANAKRESEPSSTSLHVNVGLEVFYNKRGGYETKERNRNFRKEKRNKSVHGNEKGRHESFVHHTNRRRRRYSRGVERNGNLRQGREVFFIEGLRGVLRCL